MTTDVEIGFASTGEGDWIYGNARPLISNMASQGAKEACQGRVAFNSFILKLEDKNLDPELVAADTSVILTTNQP